MGGMCERERVEKGAKGPFPQCYLNILIVNHPVFCFDTFVVLFCFLIAN